MNTTQITFFATVALIALGMHRHALAQVSLHPAAQSASTFDMSFSVDPLDSDAVSLSLFGDASNDGWRVDLHTWIWMMGIEGDVAARGHTASVDASFFDVLDASDSLIGLAGRLEVGKGDWGGFVDGLYNKIGVDDATGPLGLTDVDVTFEMVIVDFGVMYRLGNWRVDRISDDAQHNAVTLDIYAGARYTDLSMEVDPAMLASVDQDRDWIDPIVGAKVVMPLADQLQFSVWGDIGGFGVGSDFTWSATGVLSYEFPLFGLDMTAYAGYRALGQDYSRGSGAEEFVWDVTLHGPIIGLKVRF